jgi:hypothetical protein
MKCFNCNKAACCLVDTDKIVFLALCKECLIKRYKTGLWSSRIETDDLWDTLIKQKGEKEKYEDKKVSIL